jgi:NADH-quinone oxidoreductase subunit M
MYFLIGIWGGPRREYAAIKFFLYTLLGSVLMLLAMLAFYFLAPGLVTDPATLAELQAYSKDLVTVAADGTLSMNNTFDLVALSIVGGSLTGTLWTLAWFGLFIGFAIKVPVWPFHTWLPDAHVEAPTAISVILAGVLLKMGTYGLFRISFPLLPEQTGDWAWMIATLGVINIVYGAMCALAQTDLKKMVAYSSVSHMGYVLLGMAALTPEGFTGALLQMFNHGTITGMLFILVGVVYDRAHHREINGFGGIWKPMPWFGGLTAFAWFAALGLPGLSGFISEALCFLGAFNEYPLAVSISVSGVVLGAAYMLWSYQRVFLGATNEKYAEIPDINGREVGTLIPLMVIVLLVGVYPMPLLNMMNTSLQGLINVMTGA